MAKRKLAIEVDVDSSGRGRRTLKEIGNSTVALGPVFKAAGIAAAAAGAAIVALGVGIAKLGARGSGLSAIADSFERLTSAAGQSGDEMVRMTRTATKGLIKDLDIMQAANKGLLLGLPVTSREMANLAKTATVLGKAMGQDAGKSLDDLIVALGRSSPEILDNLGLSVKMGEANQAYALALGKTVEQLTEAEKKQAFYNAAMDAARTTVDGLGGITLTFGDRLEQANVSWQNFVDALSIAIAKSPVLNALLDELGRIFETSLGDRQASAVTLVVSAIEGIALALEPVIQFTIQSVQVFLDFFAMIERVNASVIRFVSNIVELGSVLPFVGENLQSYANHLKLGADNADRVADVSKGMADRLQSVRDVVSRVGSAMRNAGSAARSDLAPAEQVVEQRSVTMGTAVESAAASVQTLKEAEKQAAEEAKAFADMITRVTQKTNEMNRLNQQVGAMIVETNKKFGDYGLTLESTGLQIDVLSTGALVGLQNNLSKANLEAVKAPGIFGQIGTSLGGLKDKFFDWGNVVNGVMQGAFGPGGFVAGLAQQGMQMLAGLIGKGLKKIGGFFKDLFGGPSAKELAGREIVEQFQGNMDQILTDTQRVEAGGELWKATNIAVRDSYLAVGLSEREALADVEKLYAGIKQGPSAVNPQIELIRSKMQGLAGATQDAARAFRDLTGAAASAPTAPAVSSFSGPINMASGGSGTVFRPTLFRAGEGGPERFSFGGTGGGRGPSQGNITINVQGGFIRDPASARALATEINRATVRQMQRIRQV